MPCYKIYEDGLVLAFLDINPFSSGHTLLIPKERVATLDKLSAESASAIGKVLPKISKAILEVVNTKEFNIIQNNGSNAFQTIPHVHFHIIPKFEDGLGYQFPSKTYTIDHNEALILANKISSILSD